ncbi:hypothetical protein R3X26_12030 [Vibrio sp. TH_r3]|uniref:aldose epimerase family protein n=1 Tax=Vibrio sp. TH_r3 TaxID=3082084 RepID=UPI002954BE99|nr:hypothetical protein [Vibrio sp. TH_r3]MDV7105131.1 hypothetical protein [Vibrio sp. TH_r3]
MPESVSIVAHGYSAQIKIKGAELVSFYCLDNNQNWMWKGESWPNSAPILFPIVGNLVDGMYRYNGKRYALNRHGFARNKLFHITERTEEKVTLQLCSSNETREQYPFDFVLEVTFSLQPRGLEVSYKISNSGREAMWFSIGSHPGLEIGRNAVVKFEFVSQPFIGNKGFTSLTEQANISILDKKIVLEQWDFSNGPLYFTDLPAQSIVLEDQTFGMRVIEIDDSPFFALWKLKGENFICLEPWQGITSSGEEESLPEKRGMIRLEADNQFNTYYRLLTTVS